MSATRKDYCRWAAKREPFHAIRWRWRWWVKRRFFWAFASGWFCLTVVSLTAWAVQGNRQATLWNWLLMAAAFLTGFIASRIPEGAHSMHRRKGAK